MGRVALAFGAALALAAWEMPAFAHQPYPAVNACISCPRDRVVWVNTRSGVYHY